MYHLTSKHYKPNFATGSGWLRQWQVYRKQWTRCKASSHWMWTGHLCLMAVRDLPLFTAQNLPFGCLRTATFLRFRRPDKCSAFRSAGNVSRSGELDLEPEDSEGGGVRGHSTSDSELTSEVLFSRKTCWYTSSEHP